MAERAKHDIDNISFIVKMDDASSRSVIVYVHGFLGSAEETWGGTIQLMMSSPSFAAFDYASFGYNTEKIDLAAPDRGAELLLPWVESHLGQYNNIYFVAHSMGGLLVRHLVVKALYDPTKQDCAERVRGCFLIASPITGSAVAKAARWTPASLFNRRVAYLAEPTIDGKNMSDAYNDAVAAYTKRGGSKANVPRFYYFVGERDNLAQKPQEWFFTDFDHYVGTFPGSHSSIKEELDENSTLIVSIRDRIKELESSAPSIQREKIEGVRQANRKREEDALAGKAIERRREREATMVQSVARSSSSAARLPLINVLLISCSKTKSDKEEVEHPRHGGIDAQLANKDLAEVLMDTRGKILRLVQRGDVDGVELGEGNRAASRANESLVLGPDFSGPNNGLRYLPAYSRYTGRCFRPTAEEWSDLYSKPDHPSVLIMSGLYGLIPATEHIQNYDVHLTDVDSSRAVSIQTHWRDREVMTQILASHLEWIEETRGRVGIVVDALSELSYQETINWSMIYPRWPVLHRVFRERAGREALENLGIWIRDAVRRPEILGQLVAGQFYENPNFISRDAIAFEERIGVSTLAVARQVAP